MPIEKRRFIKRVELSIPYNSNSAEYFDMLISDILSYFEGGTVLRGPSGGLWFDSDDSTDYNENTHVIIVYYDPVRMESRWISPENYLMDIGDSILMMREKRSIMCFTDGDWLNFTQ